MRGHTRKGIIYVRKVRNPFMERKAMVKGYDGHSEKDGGNMQNNFTQGKNESKPDRS